MTIKMKQKNNRFNISSPARACAAALLALATVAFTGCGKNDDALPQPDNGELKIIATIAASPDADVLPAGRSAGTRATLNPDGSGTFATGEVFTLRVTGSKSFPLTTSYTIGTTVLRWDDFASVGNESTLTFSGYYPENAGVDNNKEFNLLRATNPDLLVAPPVTVARGGTVCLAFRHVMHRLVVNLSGNALTADELSGATVQLSYNLCSKALIDFTNATAFTTTTHYTYPSENPPTQTGASTTFILVPQDLESFSGKITITAGGQELTYTFPATLPGATAFDPPRRLQSGRTLTLNLAVNTGSAAAFASPSTRATATDDALMLECVGIDVSGW